MPNKPSQQLRFSTNDGVHYIQYGHGWTTETASSTGCYTVAENVILSIACNVYSRSRQPSDKRARIRRDSQHKSFNRVNVLTAICRFVRACTFHITLDTYFHGISLQVPLETRIF